METGGVSTAGEHKCPPADEGWENISGWHCQVALEMAPGFPFPLSFHRLPVPGIAKGHQQQWYTVRQMEVKFHLRGKIHVLSLLIEIQQPVEPVFPSRLHPGVCVEVEHGKEHLANTT